MPSTHPHPLFPGTGLVSCLELKRSGNRITREKHINPLTIYTPVLQLTMEEVTFILRNGPKKKIMCRHT